MSAARPPGPCGATRLAVPDDLDPAAAAQLIGCLRALLECLEQRYPPADTAAQHDPRQHVLWPEHASPS